MIEPQAIRAEGLSEDEVLALRECMDVRHTTRRKNLLRSTYYDSKQMVRDLGISIPPSLQNVSAALGWPSRAVQALTRKHKFEGFSLDSEFDPFDTSGILSENSFELELLQAVNATYKHSCSFLTTTHGDPSAGDPDVLIQARDAEDMFAVWDKRRRDIKHALAIVDVDDEAQPIEAILYLRGLTIAIRRRLGIWRVEQRWTHRSNRTLVEQLPADPQLNRPFGRSRITREVRYLTDTAIRTMIRAEVSAEFFAAPQRYVLGADEDAFKDQDRWSAITGRMLALSTNDEGDRPSVGQFPAQSPDGHWGMYRQLAQNFASATGLPQSQVGLFADNPASAEAMQTAESALADEAEYQWKVFRPSLRRVLQNVVMLRDNEAPRSEVLQTNVNWTPARYVSPQAASDWAVKAVSADPTLQGSTVIRRRLGLAEGEISEIRSDERRMTALDSLAQMTGRGPGSNAESDAEVS